MLREYKVLIASAILFVVALAVNPFIIQLQHQSLLNRIHDDLTQRQQEHKKIEYNQGQIIINQRHIIHNQEHIINSLENLTHVKT